MDVQGSLCLHKSCSGTMHCLCLLSGCAGCHHLPAKSTCAYSLVMQDVITCQLNQHVVDEASSMCRQKPWLGD